MASLYLKDYPLPALFEFVSKNKLFSDIHTDLFSCTKFDLVVVDSFTSKKNTFFLDSRFYIDNYYLNKIINRFTNSKINVSIYENGNLIFKYYSSDFSVCKNYDITQVPFLKKIDYSLLQINYKSFRSRSKNTVSISNNSINKSSNDVSKIKQEYDFLKKYSELFDFYIPVCNYKISNDIASYSMPSIKPGDISSYYIRGENVFFESSSFFKFCVNYFKKISDFSISGNSNVNIDFESIYHRRLRDRRNNFINQFFSLPDINESFSFIFVKLYNELYENFNELFEKKYFSFINKSPIGPFHGDFCLSNILYDESTNHFVLIDPRGDNNLPLCFDLAKLCHSLLGRYDLVLSKNYTITFKNQALDIIYDNECIHNNTYYNDFCNKLINELSYNSFEEIRLLESYLFFTMLIFHIDDKERCLAFLLTSRNILLELGFLDEKEI